MVLFSIMAFSRLQRVEDNGYPHGVNGSKGNDGTQATKSGFLSRRSGGIQKTGAIRTRSGAGGDLGS